MIISTELDEVMELADRIAVLYKGKLVGIVPAGTGRDVLGLMMAGISPEDAAGPGHSGPATVTSGTPAAAIPAAAPPADTKHAAAAKHRAASSPEGGDHA